MMTRLTLAATLLFATHPPPPSHSHLPPPSRCRPSPAPPYTQLSVCPATATPTPASGYLDTNGPTAVASSLSASPHPFHLLRRPQLQGQGGLNWVINSGAGSASRRRPPLPHWRDARHRHEGTSVDNFCRLHQNQRHPAHRRRQPLCSSSPEASQRSRRPSSRLLLPQHGRSPRKRPHQPRKRQPLPSRKRRPPQRLQQAVSPTSFTPALQHRGRNRHPLHYARSPPLHGRHPPNQNPPVRHRWHRLQSRTRKDPRGRASQTPRHPHRQPRLGRSPRRSHDQPRQVRHHGHHTHPAPAATSTTKTPPPAPLPTPTSSTTRATPPWPSTRQ